MAAHVQRILVIGDHAVMRQALFDMLQFAYEVTAVGIHRVPELLASREFDLTVIDCLRSDAPEEIYALGRIRRSRRPETPVIMISGNVRDTIAATQTAGYEADSYLTKPFELQTFLNMVARLIVAV